MMFFFWGCAGLVFYTYAGYPLLLWAAARCYAKPRPGTREITPVISLVIPAYNEEASIKAKLENVLALDYPRDRFEVVVVSDCSGDRTDEIVRGFEPRGVRLRRMDARGGKIAGYKAVLPSLRGEIVVFSDATSRLAPDSLKLMARNFADDSIGCVAGRLCYVDPRKAEIARGEKSYWNYESRIKAWEESLWSLTSVSGTFYAVRRELFPLEMADDLADDLIVILNCVRLGRRVILEPEAVCEEYAIHADSAEIRKRWRITLQNLRGLFSMPGMMNIRRYGWYAWMLISHKLFRVLVPVFLIGIFMAALMLSTGSVFFRAALYAQAVFYCCGIAASFWKKGRPGFLTIIYYFCVTNTAILIGIWKFLRGERAAVWETAR